ncbi:hypothetical protein E2C01_014229 [Portunus trituberculatus]|uniref:Uncharacterized protein n=1 Tax=Portunus trituberculatus TaxID=210409 RepID=A0A5B7DI90_PORTR|nr:hypothetical protein [Portunus trituberculatus]
MSGRGEDDDKDFVVTSRADRRSHRAVTSACLSRCLSSAKSALGKTFFVEFHKLSGINYEIRRQRAHISRQSKSVEAAARQSSKNKTKLYHNFYVQS